MAGRYGNGLSFDGVNDLVTVPGSSSLNLRTAMTMEAWVRPTRLSSMWRTAVIKERSNHLAYALYAANGSGVPSGHVYVSSDSNVTGPSAVPLASWTHIASTWNGSVLRLYVNGNQVSSRQLTGTAMSSSSPLRIGGTTVWAEWFEGVIDDVRVYNRALTAAQIRADRVTRIG